MGTPLLDSNSCKDLIAAVSAPGEVLFPHTGKRFEKARTSVWNIDAAGMPAAIVKCVNATNIASTLAFAKQNSLKICVHTAGAHSSHAVVDDCVVVDLSLMREVDVDEATRTATVAGGATIGDVDKAAKPYGLALPMGHVHHTGVAGMALNATSGVGYLSRTRGLTVTFLNSATLVMADGSVKKVSEGENSELLWAIRGAGSNFGITIEMVFSLTQVSPQVYAGDMVKFPKDTGPGKFLWFLNSDKTREELVMKWFSFFSDESTPDECSSMLVIAPNGPVVSRISYIPTEEDAFQPKNEIREKGKKAFEPLTDFGFTLVNNTKMADYWDGLQKMGQFNPGYYYQKAANMSALPKDLLSAVVEQLCSYAKICPVSNMGSGIIIVPLGGALARMKSGAVPTAEVYNTMKWWFIISIEYPKGLRDTKLRDKCIQWVRDVHKVVEPYSSKDEGRKPDCWSDFGDIYGSKENVDRLKDLKTKYDPNNVFSMNRNIAPNLPQEPQTKT